MGGQFRVSCRQNLARYVDTGGSPVRYPTAAIVSDPVVVVRTSQRHCGWNGREAVQLMVLILPLHPSVGRSSDPCHETVGGWTGCTD